MSHPATPFEHVVAAALKGENCVARPRKDGSGYRLVPNEPYTGVMVFNAGAVHVTGRLGRQGARYSRFKAA